MTTFLHQATVYDSDEQFLRMALPFVADGLALNEAVMVTTTPANLELLADALGADGRLVDYAETAYLGRRTVGRTTAFWRYWQRRGPGRVRVLAEPVWAGRTAHDVASWQRMESGLNLLLAGTDLWMICPYDARQLSGDMLDAARRTHPSLCEDGRAALPSGRYADPAAFIRECDAAMPMPGAPSDAASAVLGDLAALREFVMGQAGVRGLVGPRATGFTVAANEVATFLRVGAGRPLSVWLWERLGAVFCDLRVEGVVEADPMAGFLPPERRPAPGDGIWLARQFCDQVEIRPDEKGCTIRLRVPSARAEEFRQIPANYLY
ncbi:MEDS domain-containing protein [Streptosporangium soli]|nr:MEDS domain-containing protein [Streptosporangium sp. KLBMP 9127]